MFLFHACTKYTLFCNLVPRARKGDRMKNLSNKEANKVTRECLQTALIQPHEPEAL